LKFIYLTAIRIDPEHWIIWRQHISDLFKKDCDIPGFTCDDGQRSEILIGTIAEQPAEKRQLGEMFASLKAQNLFYKELSALGDHPENTSHLILLESGEICRVDVVEMDATDKMAQYKGIKAQICADVHSNIASTAGFMPAGIVPSTMINADKTAIHALMPYDSSVKAECSDVTNFFALEGLDFAEQNNCPGAFAPGWSFSAVNSSNPQEVGLFAAVVMRLQCVWYQQRGQREFCIDQTSLLARQEKIEIEITTSHQVTRRLFDFTLWEHELREFSANLKPWLKVAFDALYKQWDMAEESDYIEKTLRHTQELLASGYQSRLLIQERRQSRLLFVIAAIELLGIIGSLMSIWTALTWGNLVSGTFWTSEPGLMVLVGIIVTNFIIFLIIMYRFVTTQFK
jgi:hypothetical protein